MSAVKRVVARGDGVRGASRCGERRSGGGVVVVVVVVVAVIYRAC